MTGRRQLKTMLIVGSLALAMASTANAAPRWFVGTLHAHSGYSDGWNGSTPTDYFRSARDKHHLAFLGSSEHDTNIDLPISLGNDCFDPQTTPACLIADHANPFNSFNKWVATAQQAKAETRPDFAAFRGFEWSSDIFGHINVYFSSNWIHGNPLPMQVFYSWLTSKAGGGDGLATFNHPGDKSLCQLTSLCDPTKDPDFNWNNFAYVPAADPQMVGIETFNGDSDFGSFPSHHSPKQGWYVDALDKGWHVGAIGAEDKGHNHGDDWGSDKIAKTVILADSDTTAALKAAMKARHFYAIDGRGYALKFSLDGATMGDRLVRKPGSWLTFKGSATGLPGRPPLTLDLITSGGKVVASGTRRLNIGHRAAPGSEKYYFLRARDGIKPVAYSSPIWITSD